MSDGLTCRSAPFLTPQTSLLSSQLGWNLHQTRNCVLAPLPLSAQVRAGLLRWLRVGELLGTHKESSGVLGRSGLLCFETGLEL